MRRSLLPGLCLLAACQSADLIAEGDAHYSVGRFQLALDAYEAAAGGDLEASAGSDLGARITKARYMVLAHAARTSIHEERPREALDFLTHAEVVLPGQELTEELRQRARGKLGRSYSEAGRDLFEDGRAEEARSAYRQALAWDPDSEDARAGFARASERAEVRAQIGERLYFEGLEELREGRTLRARTAFLHSATFWGEDSRAASLLEELSADLSNESKIQGLIYLESGMIGPAWMALSDANHLKPGDPEVERLLEEIDQRRTLRSLLDEADHALRGGRVAEVEAVLARAAEVPAAAEDVRVPEMHAAAAWEENRQRYVLARACELDNQIVRAAGLYGEILAAVGSDGYEDVDYRARLLEERLAKAEEFYQQALAAEAAGDQDAYRENLAQTIRLASDYADALSRFSRL